jgi:phosphatidylinositol-3-phosphatase
MALAIAAAIGLAACGSTAPSVSSAPSGAADTPTATSIGSPGSTLTQSASPSASPSPTPPPPSGNLPNFSHVYVIIFENKEYSSIVGSSSAPYINSLIAQYGLSTSFYAERHPSEPNYIALTSGGTQGITDDGVYNLGVNNLFDQVEASGRTWHAYMQGYPGNCSTASSSSAVTDGAGKSGAYVRKHDPAISYTSISGNPTRCASITSFANFDPAAANFEFITPNMINDMHDGTVADGDNFLKAFLPKITSSSAFTNSVVYVTFDEGTTNVNGGGHIATIAITPNMTAGYKASATYTHYSMLRTIEQAWGLPYLGSASSASSMAFPY